MTHNFKLLQSRVSRVGGQRYEHDLFDTYDAAKAYRDRINDHNKPGFVPNWYMIAEDEIRVVEVADI